MCKDCRERWALSNGRCYQCAKEAAERLRIRHGDKPEVLRLRAPETSAPAEAF